MLLDLGSKPEHHAHCYAVDSYLGSILTQYGTGSGIPLQAQLLVFHSFSNSTMLLCRGLLCAVHFPPTSSLFTCMSFCSAPVLHFLRLRLLLPFVKGVRVTSIREGCLCLLLCRLSLLSLEPCRNSRGETACPTLFTSGGVCCPLFKV